jgi:hypothetical protein
MKITGKEGGPLDKETAAKWTANYRESKQGKAHSHLFGAETVKRLLEQEGCVGMRIYYALNEEGEQQLLLIGADVDGNDLPESEVLDFAHVCPPYCDSSGSELAG